MERNENRIIICVAEIAVGKIPTDKQIVRSVTEVYVTLLRLIKQLLLFPTLSLQKKAIRLNNQGKTMIAKDSFVPLL